MLDVAKTTDLLVHQFELVKGDIVICQVDKVLTDDDEADLNRAILNAISRTGKVISTAIVRTDVLELIKIDRVEATRHSYVFFVDGDSDYAHLVQEQLRTVLKYVVVIPKYRDRDKANA